MPNTQTTLASFLSFYNPDGNSSSEDTPNNIQLISDTISVGVEVELENLASNWLGSSATSYWEVVNDGSLRGVARELRSRGPVRGQALKRDLVQLFQSFVSHDLIRHANARTSMHVHVNVLDLTKKQFRSFLAVACLADSILFKHTGPNRPFTGYSAPTANNLAKLLGEASLMPPVGELQGSLTQFTGFSSESLDSRYQSVNLQALTKHGTVEFRHFETPPTRDKMVTIINACMKVKLAAIEMAEAISEDNYNEADFLYDIAKRILSEHFPEYTTDMNKENFCELFELGILLSEYTITEDSTTMDEEVPLFQAMTETEPQVTQIPQPVTSYTAIYSGTEASASIWIQSEFLRQVGLQDSYTSPLLEPSAESEHSSGDYRRDQSRTSVSTLRQIIELLPNNIRPLELYLPVIASPTRANRYLTDNSEQFRGIRVAANSAETPQGYMIPVIDDQVNPRRSTVYLGAVIRLGSDNNLYAVATRQERMSDTNQRMSDTNLITTWTLVNIAPEISTSNEPAEDTP